MTETGSYIQQKNGIRNSCLETRW